MHATYDVQNFTTPNFPDDYPPNQNCKWTIYAVQGSRIQANVKFSEIEGDSDDYCRQDYLQFRNGEWKSL